MKSKEFVSSLGPQPLGSEMLGTFFSIINPFGRLEKLWTPFQNNAFKMHVTKSSDFISKDCRENQLC